ncbi:glycosyltransferase family 4 protein [Paraconexibacter algicola]|uniref:Glycosyltransferase family 1 protein n=1 Tax=Paraconexibacter algicola TaxID=2133960 RepID=A0A2T4UC79_9ACTN|nr:glycosyltransferase family 4 protein [Paraconexibacter algicola]PTL54819.1 glycosyltransferase family 1 protein [Paraconexibacter algicola]
MRPALDATVELDRTVATDLSERILLVTPGYPPDLGGIEHHVAQLARGIVTGTGCEVVVATFGDPGDEEPRVEHLDGVTVHRFPLTVARPAYRYSRDLHAWLRAHGRDFGIVHSHGYHALPALAASRIRGPVTVFTPHYHGTGHSLVRRYLHRVYRPAGHGIMRRADAILCVSEAEAARVRRHFPSTGSKIHVVPNGVDPPSAFTPPMTSRETVVLCSGRLEAYKGVDHLVAAAAELGDDYRVVVTGDGPHLATLRELAARLGVQERVLLTGILPVEELQRWQRAAAVYVTLSTNEAFNIAAYEAAGAGARIVASDIPAHREMLDRLLPGTVVLVPARPDVPALARVIEASAGLERVTAPQPVPTWTDAVQRVVSIYREELASPSRVRAS